MDEVSGRLTVFFEDPFWVGVYERRSGGELSVCKVTFSAEPKDSEVYQLFLSRWNRLAFSPTVMGNGAAASGGRSRNPKRLQREIRRQLGGGVGTKAQQALKLQQEQGKRARKARAKARRETEKDRQFFLRQQKKKEKHRGH